MQGLSSVLVRPLAFSLHSTELCHRWSITAAKSKTEHQLSMNTDEDEDLLVMYFSGFQANAQTWLPDSPLSSACSSITMELYFSVSLNSCCRDTALLYLSCYGIVALGFTYLLLRNTSVLMWSSRMFSRPDSPSRLSPSWRKHYLLPWNLWKVNTSQS